MIRTAIKFGIFGLVCLSMTAWLAFTIGNVQLFADRYSITADFDDVTGLLVNDKVKIAGVAIGKVTGISAHDGDARVTFQIDSDYDLPTDSSAAVRWRNLIGQRYLYVYPGTASTMLEDGDEITTTAPVVDLGELFNRLGPIVAAVDEGKVNDFLETVSGALNGNESQLSQAIDDLASLASTLADRDDAIGNLIENLNTVTGTITNRDQQIRTMLDNLVLISQAFSDNTAILDDALVQFGDFSASLNAILTNNGTEIDRLIANLDLVVQTIGSKVADGTLDHALAGLPAAASRIFGSSRLGEWLNQDILCAAIGPPPASGAPCLQLPIGGGLLPLDTAGAPGAATTDAPDDGTVRPPQILDLDPILSGLDPILAILTGGQG